MVLKSLGVNIEDVVVSPSYCGSYNKYAFYLKTRNRSFLFGEIMTPYVCSFSEDIILFHFQVRWWRSQLSLSLSLKQSHSHLK